MNTPLPADHAARMERAALALTGLSVGDALGETCFRDENYEAILDDPRATARGPWPWTDDTAMALAVYEVLSEYQLRHRRRHRGARDRRGRHPRRLARAARRVGGVNAPGLLRLIRANGLIRAIRS